MQSAIIKWFPDRSFGFITNPSNSSKNIFFHKSALRFPQNLADSKGEVVEFELVEDADGRFSASDLVLINRPQITFESYEPEVRYCGVVRFFSTDGGYITCEGHEDVPYSIDDVRGRYKPKKGDRVTFSVALVNEHLNAVQVASVHQPAEADPGGLWTRPKRPEQPKPTVCDKQPSQAQPPPTPKQTSPVTEPWLREELYGDNRDRPASKHKKDNKGQNRT